MKEVKEVIANVIESIDMKDLVNRIEEKLDGEQFVRIVGAALIAVVTMGNMKGGE